MQKALSTENYCRRHDGVEVMNFKVLVLLSLVVLSQAACGITIPREEVLECGLPDGSKFVLRAKYDWDPLAQLIPADITERYNEQNFKVSFYGIKKFRRSIDIPIEAIEHTRLGDSGTAKGLCLEFALIRGNAVVYQYIILSNDYAIKEIKADTLKGISITASENSPTVQSKLVAHKLEPLYGTSFFGYINGRYVHEQGLAEAGQKCDSRAANEKQCLIVAVSRNISTDNGRTWIGPIITNKAEIFELGKSLREQSFVARPLRVNGKNFARIEQEEARLEAKQAKEKQTEQALFRRQTEEYKHSLHSAIESGDMNGFEQRLNADVDINAPSSQDGRAPLMLALDKPEYAPYALALIQRGANLTPKGIYEGVTVLMLAAGSSTPEVMQALLAKQKYDINQRNPNGATALSYAVAAGMTDNVKFLLEQGANVGVKSGEGGLIEIARQQGYTEIVRLLEQRKR